MHAALRTFARLRRHARQCVAFSSGTQSRVQRIEELADMLRSQHGVDVSGVHVREFPGFGVGLAAARDFAASEVVLRLPRAAWHPFSAEAAEAQARAGAPGFVQRVEALAQQLRERDLAGWKRLVPSTLLSMHVLLGIMDHTSPHATYFRTLPHHVDMPVLWQPRELEELRGTPVPQMVAELSSFLQALHHALFVGDAAGGPPAVSLPQLAWAVCTVLSRAHSTPTMPLTLVPLVDCLNHSSHPSCDASKPADAEHMDVVALQPLTAGDQLLISYGARSNAKLLHNYGFVEANNSHDYVRVPLALALARLHAGEGEARGGAGAADSSLERHRRELLARHQLDVDAAPPPLHVSAQGVAIDAIMWLRASACDEGDLGTGGWSACQLRDPLSSGNERRVLQAVRDCIHEALAQYPASEQEDEERLALHHSGKQVAPPRLATALALRLGEKRLLRGQLENAEQALRLLG